MAGCSAGYVQVRGKATVDGKPLTKGAIRFIPDKDNTLQAIAQGIIDSEGNYELSTADKEGVPLGSYKVCFIFRHKKSPDWPLPSPPVDAKYMNPAQTPFTVQVVANPEPGAYDFNFTEK